MAIQIDTLPSKNVFFHNYLSCCFLNPKNSINRLKSIMFSWLNPLNTHISWFNPIKFTINSTISNHGRTHRHDAAVRLQEDVTGAAGAFSAAGAFDVDVVLVGHLLLWRTWENHGKTMWKSVLMNNIRGKSWEYWRNHGKIMDDHVKHLTGKIRES